VTTVKILITLKSGVLDAPGQAIRQGLRALEYGVEEVRAGKYLEIELPESIGLDGRSVESLVDEMCSRFLANPLVESWRIVEVETGESVETSVSAR
jgi:phosphoribosylformylglycinamidine synthase PurS subunit